MAASELDVILAGVLLLALTPLVVAGPPRWAVLAWLAMTNLDATGSGQATNLQIGWLNALKGVVLPGWLALRLRNVPGRVHASPAARCWLGLAVYAGLAATWSEFPIAGAKLALGMVGILLAAVALERAARAGMLEKRAVFCFLWASLLLAVVQTAFFANGSFGYAGRGMPERLTSFVAAQQFAALLVAFLAWVVWTPGLAAGARWGLMGLLLAALAANGSRTWSAGALAVLVVHAFVKRGRAEFGRIAAAVLILASVPAVRRGLQGPAPVEPANRLAATASALLSGQDRADGMGLGTARFRLRMYRGVIAALRDGPRWQWLLGHGTASGGTLALKLFPWAYRRESLDAGRAIHNEWLRAVYEWGLAGTTLWLGTLAGLLAFAWRERQRWAGAALLSYMPALCLGLTTENILDGAGNAVTAGLLVLVALALAGSRETASR